MQSGPYIEWIWVLQFHEWSYDTEIQYYIICMLHSRSSMAENHIDHFSWLTRDWRSILMGLRWLDNVEIPVLAYYMLETTTDSIFPRTYADIWGSQRIHDIWYLLSRTKSGIRLSNNLLGYTKYKVRNDFRWFLVDGGHTWINYGVYIVSGIMLGSSIRSIMWWLYFQN